MLDIRDMKIIDDLDKTLNTLRRYKEVWVGLRDWAGDNDFELYYKMTRIEEKFLNNISE